jgi:hypothetical protein
LIKYYSDDSDKHCVVVTPVVDDLGIFWSFPHLCNPRTFITPESGSRA